MIDFFASTAFLAVAFIVSFVVGAAIGLAAAAIDAEEDRDGR